MSRNHPHDRSQRTVQMPGGFAAGQHGGHTTPDERQWALTAYIGQFLLWIVPPAYVYLTKRNRSAYARHHARQALNLALTTGVVVLVCLLLTRLGSTFAWIALGWACLSLLVCAWSATRVNQGKWHTIPQLIAWPIVK